MTPIAFAQIRKVDAENRLVYGRLADASVDKADEAMDYEKSVPYFKAWSEGIAKDTDGKSVGNLRAMHGKVAAGKFTEIQFNDAEKAIDVVAHVVDNNEWEKVLKGVYTGFSIGGNYVGERSVEKMADGREIKRYVADPTEGSLVDRPCNPNAKFFDVRKADGSTEQVAFADPDTELVVKGTDDEVAQLAKVMNEQGLTLADVLVKIAKRPDVEPKEGEHKYGDVEFADAKNKKYPIDTAEHIRAAWNYINKEKDASEYGAEDVAAIKAKIVAAWKDKIDAGGPPSAEKMAKDELRKALYAAESLPPFLASLDAIAKSEHATLGAIAAVAAAMLKAAVADDTELEKAHAPLAAFVKMGARNSAADQALIQHAHDALALLGAECGDGDGDKDPEPGAGDTDPTAKHVHSGTLQKALEPLQKALDLANEKIAKLEAMPAPSKVVLRVTKSQDEVIDHTPASFTAKDLVKDADGEVNTVASLIKASHMQGGQPLRKPNA